MKKHISSYQFITSRIAGSSHAEPAELACLGGATWIQFRDKDLSGSDLEICALEVQRVCDRYKAAFIVNDHVLLAEKLNASGVHLGKSDLPVSEARTILGADKIIGGTANDLRDMIRLTREGVDYIGLGPLRFTKTKKALSAVLGIKKMKQIVAAYRREVERPVPVVAIGGITITDVRPILEAGLNGCAVSSAVTASQYKIISSAKFAHELRSARIPVII